VNGKISLEQKQVLDYMIYTRVRPCYAVGAVFLLCADDCMMADFSTCRCSASGAWKSDIKCICSLSRRICATVCCKFSLCSKRLR
jgi:hypothetical protein